MRFLFTLLLFLSTLSAQEIVLEPDVEKYNLVPLVDVATAVDNEIDIEAVLEHKLPFQKSQRDFFYFHFSDKSYWFQFSLSNPSVETLSYRLNIPTSWLDEVRLYTIHKDGSYTMNRSGDHVPKKELALPNRSIVFALDVTPGEHLYYLRIRSDDALQVPIFLTQTELFYSEENLLNIFFGVITGIIIMMILYALFYYIYLRDHLYAIYAGYIFLFIMMVLSTHGYFLHYLWPDAFWFNERFYIFSFIGYLGFMTWFAKEFLNTKAFSPFWDKALIYATVFHLGIVLLAPVLPYPLVMQIGIATAAVIPFVLIIPTVMAIRSGQKWAKFYLFGWLPNTVFYTLWALSFFAIIPYSLFLNNANSIGIVIELLIFSLGMVYRVEEIVRSEYRLSHDIKKDALTQVANRYAFNQEFPQRLDAARAAGQHIYFVMLDVDAFKLYNDTYGHPMGDEALKIIASTLKSRLQRSCDSIYRLGGEEFGLLLCADQSEKVEEMVERLRASIEAQQITFKESKAEVVTASFGLLIVRPETAIDYTEVYQHADKLLYQAKAEGRNCVVSQTI